jgi:hypothetical protein
MHMAQSVVPFAHPVLVSQTVIANFSVSFLAELKHEIFGKTSTIELPGSNLKL